MIHDPYTKSEISKKQLWQLIVAVFATGEGSGLALMAMRPQSAWFTQLVLSPVHPPTWLFGLIWTTLYVLMGSSFVISLLHPNVTKSIHIGYIINIFLGALWSPAFFLLENPTLAILLAIGTIINAVILFPKVHKISKEAAFLMIPYIIWLIFATYLNAAVLFLNK
ncbi:MAG: TspO/MBR family protein [Christensenellaceae bacterium]